MRHFPGAMSYELSCAVDDPSENHIHQAGEHSLSACQHPNVLVHEEHHQSGQLNHSLAAHQQPAFLVHEEHY